MAGMLNLPELFRQNISSKENKTMLPSIHIESNNLPRIYYSYFYRSYKEVLGYYKKSERARLNGLEYSPYRSLDGEMDVELVKFR